MSLIDGLAFNIFKCATIYVNYTWIRWNVYWTFIRLIVVVFYCTCELDSFLSIILGTRKSWHLITPKTEDFFVKTMLQFTSIYIVQQYRYNTRILIGNTCMCVFVFHILSQLKSCSTCVWKCNAFIAKCFFNITPKYTLFRDRQSAFSDF